MARKVIEVVGTPLTGRTEELSALCGRRCSKKTKERPRWCLVWLKHSNVLAFQSCGPGPGRRASISPRRFCVCHAGSSNTSGGYSLKGAVWSRSRPSRHPPWVDMELFAPSRCEGVSASEAEGFCVKDET